jgi:hypothetical protein
MRILLTPEERKIHHAAATKKYRATPRYKALKRMSNARQYAKTAGARERVIEKYLVDRVMARGGFCPKFVDPGRRGAPDRLVIFSGHPTYFVELKRPTLGQLMPWQKQYHDKLRECGQKVWVLSTIEQVDEFIASLNA